MKTYELGSKAVVKTTNVQRKKSNGSPLEVMQRVQPLEEEELLQGKFQPVQRQVNNTGLPDNLKSGIENLSGYSMDDVKVHYNSDQPAQLNAHAYAQGTDIHLAPGQEQHLPHEAWHVVQQKQGRVRPTMQMKGKVNINDDVGLEREADVMGARAVQSHRSIQQRSIKSNPIANIVQREEVKSDKTAKQVGDAFVGHHLGTYDNIDEAGGGRTVGGARSGSLILDGLVLTIKGEEVGAHISAHPDGEGFFDEFHVTIVGKKYTGNYFFKFDDSSPAYWVSASGPKQKKMKGGHTKAGSELGADLAGEIGEMMVDLAF